MSSQVSLTSIQSIFSSFHNDKSPPCLKVVKIRRTASEDVNYKLRLSDGTSQVQAYFVNPGFDRFVEDGSIKVGTIIELKGYILGIHNGNRYLGIVRLHPSPQLEHGVENDAGASIHQNENQTTKKRHRDGGEEGKAVEAGETSRLASKTELSGLRIDNHLDKKARPLGPMEDTPIVIPPNLDQHVQHPQKRPETSSAPLESMYGNGIVTARQHLNRNSNDAISPSGNVIKLNSFLIHSSQLTADMRNMKRTMLNDLAGKHKRNANFLVVVLEKRQRHDNNSFPKQDWYLWDQSSKDRKTILSVWNELSEDFQPAPGTIVALWGVQINTLYEDNPNSSRLLLATAGGLGHLNAYKQKHPRSMIDPNQVVGYEEIRAAWEEYQRIYQQ